MNSATIRKYLEATPFANTYFSENGQFVFCTQDAVETLADGSRISVRKLNQLRLKDGENSLENAEVALNENLLGRSLRVVDYLEKRNELLIVLDVANEEHYNLHSIDLSLPVTARSLVKLTNAENVMNPIVSRDRESVWFTDRRAQPQDSVNKFVSTLYRYDFETRSTTKYMDDSNWSHKFAYALVKEWQPDKVIVFLDEGGTRQRLQLFSIDLKSEEIAPLLPESMISNGNWMSRVPIENDVLYFLSNSSGFDNAYRLGLKNGDLKRLTDFKAKVNLGYINTGADPLIYSITEDRATRNSTVNIQSLDGRDLHSETHEGSVTVSSASGPLWLHTSSMCEGAIFRRLWPQTLKPTSLRKVKGDIQELIHCNRSVTQFESFDGLSIPTLIFKPKHLNDSQILGAIVIAFYGGDDFYATRYQMFLEAGWVVVSPAVRGSWGWGKDWESKIRGDLGGNEILDLIWCSRFIANTLNLRENQVVIEGGSHGGYSTLRALTFPNPYKGQNTGFDFAGGICWAGFADLEAFYRDSWISDWLVDFLGPYDPELYRDRSPLHHVAALRAPLFITHGENDQRVPISTMTQFIEKLSAPKILESKPCTFVIKKGEGHGVGGIDSEIQILLEQFRFLDELLSRSSEVNL